MLSKYWSRDQVLTLDSDYFLFNERSGLYFGNEFHCPFHAASLRHPTTLRALLSAGEVQMG